MPTKQETFDKVLQHARTQNCKATRSTGSGQQICAYRGDNGTKCFAGALIPDEAYTPILRV